MFLFFFCMDDVADVSSARLVECEGKKVSERDGEREAETREEEEKKDERARAHADFPVATPSLSPRHWHGAIRPSVSESKQMRQKTGCCGCCGCCCCCEEEAGSAARRPPATLRGSSDDVDDSAPTFRAEAGAEEQRIEAVVPAVVEVGAVSPATPGGSGGRKGGLLSMEREREKREPER